MAIRIQDLSKSFGGQEVFRNFSLDLPDAGCVCLFGPSGSGKSTLLNMLSGITQPDAGTIALPSGFKVSYVFQEDRLLPWINALENVKLALEDKDAKSAQADALFWLETLGLSDVADKLPGELSGGMRQRVSLARAFAYGGILLLDEPFQGIDAQAKEGIFTLLDGMKKDRLVALITHYPEEAVRLADCIHILQYPPARIADTITISDALRADQLQSAQTIKKLAAHGQPAL